MFKPWYKDYNPTRQELDHAYKQYSGQQQCKNAMIKKSSKLTRKVDRDSQ